MGCRNKKQEDSCKDCRFCVKGVESVTIHPTSSSCIWRDIIVYKCKKHNKTMSAASIKEDKCSDFNALYIYCL